MVKFTSKQKLNLGEFFMNNKVFLRKTCSVYASDIHLATMTFPFINKEIENGAVVKPILEKNISDSIKKIINNMGINEEAKDKIEEKPVYSERICCSSRYVPAFLFLFLSKGVFTAKDIFSYRKKIQMYLCSFHKLYKLIVNLTKKQKEDAFLLFKMT